MLEKGLLYPIATSFECFSSILSVTREEKSPFSFP